MFNYEKRIKENTMLHFSKENTSEMLEKLSKIPEYYSIDKNEYFSDVYFITKTKRIFLFSIHPNWVVYKYGENHIKDRILLKNLSHMLSKEKLICY